MKDYLMFTLISVIPQFVFVATIGIVFLSIYSALNLLF